MLMLQALAPRRRRSAVLILVLAALFAVAAFAYGAGAREAMTNEARDFEDPGSESAWAAEKLGEASGASPEADAIALVEGGDPADVGEAVEDLEADPAVARARPVPATRGGDAYVVASFRPDLGAGVVGEAAERLRRKFSGAEDVTLGEEAVVAAEVGERMEGDAARAELLAFPLLLAGLLWVFRGVVAALLPLLVAALGVGGALAALRLAAGFVPLSVFALNVVLALGLGLAIDYSLLIVSRYREEISRRGPGPEALAATLSTAGRTVLVSGLTVAAAMGALTLFPLRFLQSLGAGGLLVSLFALAGALVVLPAALALLGERVYALSLPGRRRSPPVEASGWYRLSRLVMRRPAAVAVVASAALVVLALPALGIRFVGLTAEVLPRGADSRAVAGAVEEGFPGGGPASIHLAVRASATASAGEELAGYAREIGGHENVREVGPPRAVSGGLWRIDVHPEAEALSTESQELVSEIRSAGAPYPAWVAAGRRGSWTRSTPWRGGCRSPSGPWRSRPSRSWAPPPAPCSFPPSSS